MKFEISDAAIWSEAMFGNIELGDKRLTKRLVKIAAHLSAEVGSSLSKSCGGDEALLEGGYRFVRNSRIDASQIASGGYEVTGKLAQECPLLLAIEDSTTLSYTHEGNEDLGYTTSNANGKTRGFKVHSTLLMDAKTERTIGLISQDRWCRSHENYGKRADRSERLYQEKESYKWERNSHELENRLGKKLEDTISVCDREADVYEYIQYKLENGHRFIVRACQNRKIYQEHDNLFNRLLDSKSLGTYLIEIQQKSGRIKRVAELELKAIKVNLQPPRRRNGETEMLRPISLNVVHVREKNHDNEECLEWILLTTEEIETFEQARATTRYYELRWRIEDFHKAWKSGTGVEKLRMQSNENLEKMAVILSFIAVRLIQLKEYFEASLLISEKEANEYSCEEVLSEIEWQVLWGTVEKKNLPKKVPSAAWAYKAIAKLGGWTNSKRTGKASWGTIWDGWVRLNERVMGFMLAHSIRVAKM